MAVTVDMTRTRPDRPDQGKPSLRFDCLRLQPLHIGLLSIAIAGTCDAQESIRRCIGSNGEPVFSDQPCNAIAPRDAAGTATAPATATRTHTCAISATELRERVADAFAARNALAFSGLLLWDGYRRGEATPLLQDLARLVVEPLVAIEIDGDARRSGFADESRRDAARSPWSLTIRTARDLDRVPHEAQTRFALADHGGCWWLLPGD